MDGPAPPESGRALDSATLREFAVLRRCMMAEIQEVLGKIASFPGNGTKLRAHGLALCRMRVVGRLTGHGRALC